MKSPTTLALAALLASGAALAASTPSATATATATPAPAAQPAHKHSSAMHCEKLARNKGLSGDYEKKFVKECRDGKKG